MRWRSRVQEHFFLAMESLRDANLVDPVLALSIPINWTEVPSNVSAIVSILRNFSLVEECGSLNHGLPLCGKFDAPITWLAILIMRTCTDLTVIMSYLDSTGWLGTFNRAHSKEFFPGYIDADLYGGRAVTRATELPHIGFWLPQDMEDMAPFAKDGYRRYLALERVYEECFGPGSWGDKSLIMNSITPYLDTK